VCVRYQHSKFVKKDVRAEVRLQTSAKAKAEGTQNDLGAGMLEIPLGGPASDREVYGWLGADALFSGAGRQH
jgi:hypothetical protein